MCKIELRSEERRKRGEEIVTEYMCHNSRRENYMVEEEDQQEWDKRNEKDDRGSVQMKTKYNHTCIEMSQQTLSLRMLTFLSNTL